MYLNILTIIGVIFIGGVIGYIIGWEKASNKRQWEYMEKIKEMRSEIDRCKEREKEEREARKQSESHLATSVKNLKLDKEAVKKLMGDH